MATDAKNLKISRIPAASDTAFEATTPAAGSIYYKESSAELVVGDGSSKGGKKFGSDSVRYSAAQSLTSDEQEQARSNINAVSKSGDTISGDLTVSGTATATTLKATGSASVGTSLAVGSAITINGVSVVAVPNSAAAHNGIYRGENLLSSAHFGSHSKLSAAVQAGHFSDIFIGDYFECSMTSSYATETVRWVVAGVDTYLHTGDTEQMNHHLVMIPYECFTTIGHKMNDTTTTTGGYYNSQMHQTILPAYATALKNAIGSAHVLTHRELLSNSVNTSLASMAGAGWTGATNGWGWYDCDLCLLSEVQVYGSTVFSSSFFDVGNRCRQLPYFQLQDSVVAMYGRGTSSRADWWLSAVASSSAFATVTSYGDAGSANASYTWLLVRPLFLYH